MKRIILMVLSLLFVSCEECEPVDIEDELTAKHHIAELARHGNIVDVEDGKISVDKRVIAIGPRNIKTVRLALITCDPFGWGSEYDWLCTMTGTKGRALGKDTGTPTIDDVGTYIEAGSDMYPGDITSTTYFNADTYVNQLDTNANPAAFFGLTIANFGPEWSPILEQWCTNDHIPMCQQD